MRSAFYRALGRAATQFGWMAAIGAALIHFSDRFETRPGQEGWWVGGLLAVWLLLVAAGIAASAAAAALDEQIERRGGSK